MRCALVTLVHARHDHLRLQQRALRSGTRIPEEYVVVAMDDPCVANLLERRAPAAHVLEVRVEDARLPLAHARNVGAEKALALGAELLIFLDVDCVPSRSLVERYARAAESGGESALLCGPVGYLPPPRGEYQLTRIAGEARPHPGRPVPAEDELLRISEMRLFWSLSFAVSAESWRRIGGFCSDYRGYGAEDTDFAQLAAHIGLGMLFVGGAWAYHQHHAGEHPPYQHAPDIVDNANLFHRRWGWWPMEDWLSDFAQSGLVSFDADKEAWTFVRSDSFSRPARGVLQGWSATSRGGGTMAKDHGSSVKDDKQYEGLRKKGMSKERAAKIANTPDASKKGGKSSGSGTRRDTKSQGGTKAQKAAAGRKGGKRSS